MREDPSVDRSWKYTIVYPIVSGLVLAAAYPPLPFPFGILAYVGLIPLLLVCERLSGRSAFAAGFLQGLVFYAATIYWIAWITPPGMIAAVLYLSVFRGLFTIACGVLIRKFRPAGIWCAPVLWVAFEYANSIGELGFPWAILANSQTAFLPLIQYADLTGAYGVSFWLVGVNLTGLSLLRARTRYKSFAIALVVLFGIPALHGFASLLIPTPSVGSVNIAAIQPNIEPVAKESRGFDYNWRILKPLTIQAKESGADLVLWPETAAVAYLESAIHEAYRNRIHALVDSLGIYLYTGSWYFETGSETLTYNSSSFFAPGNRRISRYDKMNLVPFGERPPFQWILPFMKDVRLQGGGYVAGNFTPGTSWTVFRGPEAKFSGMICYDSIFPGFVRKFALAGAEILVVITNDAWFGPTSGPFQHAEAAVFRAIENRRSVVRCANTGVSVVIDPYGRQSGRTGIFHEAVLNAQVERRQDLTFYTRYGDLFSQICLGVSILLLLLARGRRPAQAELSILPTRTEGSVPRREGESEGEDAEDRSMPFLDHLEELRWRIVKALLGVTVSAVCCGMFSDRILEVLIRPLLSMEPSPALIFLKPMGMFLVKLNIALVGGLIVALPIVIHQLWLFVAPGLFQGERRYALFIIVSSTVCFLCGAGVAYFAVIPLALAFLVQLSAGTAIAAQFDIGFYIGFVLRLVLVFGVVFELPIVSYFLAKVGLVTDDSLRAGRRYAVVIGFVLAALLTPPDPISQLMMALPLIVLYEISILVAGFVAPQSDVS